MRADALSIFAICFLATGLSAQTTSLQECGERIRVTHSRRTGSDRAICCWRWYMRRDEGTYRSAGSDTLLIGTKTASLRYRFHSRRSIELR